MPRPWRVRYAGAKYHLTTRGNGREVVFRRSEDYERFLSQLDAALVADQVRLYAYVVMPNHYHLFVETPLGNVQRFMQRLNTAYGMYFRFKYHRPGHCFQGRYGAKLVAGDSYILGLTRYIHLNSVKVAVAKGMPLGEKRTLLQGFAYSSYRGYVGLGPEEERVDYRWLNLMGRRTARGNRQAYARFVEAKLGEDDEVFLAEATRSRYALGDERFREATEQEVKAKRIERAETGDIVWPEDRRPPLDAVSAVAADVLGVSLEAVRFHGRRLGDLKTVVVEWCCRFSGATQRAVGKHLGFGNESAVGKARARGRAVLATDAKLAGKERELSRRLGAQP